MFKLVDFNEKFSNINLVLCSVNEIDSFINFTTNLDKYKELYHISYKNTSIGNYNNLMKINNKKKLKYKNTNIFTHFNNFHEIFSLKKIEKFQTQIFLFINSLNKEQINNCIYTVSNSYSNYSIIVSPNIQSLQNEFSYIKLSKNQVMKFTGLYKWIMYYNNQYTTLLFLKTNKIKQKNININSNINNKNKNNYFNNDELIEFIIENPIFYDQYDNTQLFF